MSDIPRLGKKDVVILDLLPAGKEMYGLEMVKASGGKLDRTSVYVYLARLEEKGFLESRQVKQEGASGMPRRLYRITGAGVAALIANQTALESWKAALLNGPGGANA